MGLRTKAFGFSLSGLAIFGTCATLLVPHEEKARAFINQVDGLVVPQTNRMQQCLDRSGTGETSAGAVDAVEDAAVLPEAYRPVESPAGSGAFPVTFQVIGEGAGYKNTFGWFWVDEDVTNTSNLHTIFDCRSGSTCSCPCDPTSSSFRNGASGTSGDDTRTINFATQPGFVEGRAIGFWIRTPELLLQDTNVSGVEADSDGCGTATDTADRIYFTSSALNDDGDYVHFLVYESQTRTNTFYFGFEDLFRGGDNDFEDVLVRAEGLVPDCTPQVETCDNADNDCDGATDEGLTQACSSACGSGVRTCSAGSYGACSAASPGTESCNNVDDDCDGQTDEGITRACTSSCGSGTEVCVAGAYADCNAPTPSIETCDGTDNDCDGMTDESLSRACETVCGTGTETCVDGTYQGCTARTPGTETCNGADDDCDARVDESITQACATACGSGSETCISGSFSGCTAPSPRVEACNALDDDCDGDIDEGLSQACSTSCGVGSETCIEGVFQGCDAPTPETEVCDNIDNDCDSVIDDGNPEGGDPCLPLEEGGYEILQEGEDRGDECVPGHVQCVGGELVCQGASSISTELCNCEDDDCDGRVDEGAGDGVCPGGACVGCTCVSPCSDIEFACPIGRECDTSLADPDRGIIGFCIPGACADVDCSDEEVCNTDTGECVNLCENRTCRDGYECVRGNCIESNCYGLGCPVGERCNNSVCEADPCSGMECQEGTYCRDGDCISVCETPCGVGQTCQNGECVASGCPDSCEEGKTCIEGECVVNACDPECGLGRVCEGTSCVQDKCFHIDCPGGYMCLDGECVVEGYTPPKAPVHRLASGGGGCSCDIASSGQDETPRGLLFLAIGVLVALVVRKRVRIVSRVGAGAVTIAASFFVQGCDVDPFCIENCDKTDAGLTIRDSGYDAQPEDGCVSSGTETCNGIDDDCDGVIDNGIDLDRDEENCGECGFACALPNAFHECVQGECVIIECELGHQDVDEIPGNGCEYECQEAGSEDCNGRDDDCDTQTDEGFTLDTDIANCGSCGTFCSFQNAEPDCVAGDCVMGACNEGFVDLDGLDTTGCELRCTPTGVEVCDETDNDCDGDIDEGFNTATDPMHCGVCEIECDFPQAVEDCTGGVCGIDSCDTGFFDIDGNPNNGCEYACSASGDDVCDGADNDCDGATDESDPQVGAACGSDTGACEAGSYACELGVLTCLGDIEGTSEVCNNIDDDCDSTTDESAAGTGVRCGESNVGRCRYGTVACSGGSLACGGTYVGPTTESCNGVDDDCDGTTDDSPSAATSTPSSCSQTSGVCAGRTMQCLGASGWGCTFPSTYQSAETICDSLDNDCDGTTDENCWTAEPSDDVRVDLGTAVGTQNSLSAVLRGDGSNRIYAAWMENLRGVSGASCNGTTSVSCAHIKFNRSTDGGDTWGSSPNTLDSGSGPSLGPVLGVTNSGQDIAAIWADFRGGTTYREIYSRYDNNFGATWSAANQRTNSSMNTDSFNLDVATSGNNVYIVYENIGSDGRTRHIYFNRSTNGGSSWGTPFVIDDSASSSFVGATPKVAAVGTNVYVVWRDNRNGALDIYFDRSASSGASGSFGTDVRLDVGTTAGASTSFSPTIAAEGTNVYVAWVDDRQDDSFDIYANVSTNSGASWRTTDSIRIDDDTLPHDSIQPQIVAPASGLAVLAWVDYRYGFPDILVSRTSNSGSSWEATTRIDTSTSAGTSGSYEVVIGASGQNIAAAWSDDRNGALDIYANFSLDGGDNWQPQDYRLDDTAVAGSSDSFSPAIWVTSGAAHVIWVDNRNGQNADIYYRRLDD